MLPGGIGAPELLLILLIVLLIFGASRLKDVGGALGTSIREFRRAVHEEDEKPEAKTEGEAK